MKAAFGLRAVFAFLGAAAFLVVAFLAGAAFLAVAFLAGAAFLAVAFLGAAAFLAVAFLAVAFLGAAAFLAGAFLAVVFLAAVFLAGAFLVALAMFSLQGIFLSSILKVLCSSNEFTNEIFHQMYFFILSRCLYGILVFFLRGKNLKTDRFKGEIIRLEGRTGSKTYD